MRVHRRYCGAGFRARRWRRDLWSVRGRRPVFLRRPGGPAGLGILFQQAGVTSASSPASARQGHPCAAPGPPQAAVQDKDIRQGNAQAQEAHQPGKCPDYVEMLR